MADLLPITLAEQLACIERELALRLRVYPRWVAAGRMTQAKADREIELMKAVRNAIVGQLAPTEMIWRHKVRGTRYRIIGEARVQCTTDEPLQDGRKVLLYQDIESGAYAVRREAEFMDGRFECVAQEEK
jgi:hypothetical protein